MSPIKSANMGHIIKSISDAISYYGWQGCVDGALKLPEHNAAPKCCCTGSRYEKSELYHGSYIFSMFTCSLVGLKAEAE